MALTAEDDLLAQVLVRELSLLGARDREPRNTASVAAQLLQTLCTQEGAPPPDKRREVDLERLGVYLASKGFVAPGTELTAARTALGFSKDTFLIGVSGTEAPAFVLRRDLAASAVPSAVADEFPLLRGLFKAGFPVAEPLVLEEDAGVLSQPFILTRMLPGESGHGVGLGSAADGQDICIKLADLLARLHGYGVEGLDAPGGDPKTVLGDYFRWWRGIFDDVGGEAFPTVSRAFDWLGSVPVVPDRLALVHGDVDFPNLLVEDRRIVGVLDWEFAHWGDTAEDLGYVREAVEKRMDWSAFLDRYAAQGGTIPTPEALRFYQLWRALRTTTTCLLARSAFDTGRNTDMRMAFAGRIILRDWVKKVEDIWAEMA